MSKDNMRIYLMMLEVPTEYLKYLLNKSEEFINRNKGKYVGNTRSIDDDIDQTSSMSSATAAEIFSRCKFNIEARF
jgi:hypothetical protein